MSQDNQSLTRGMKIIEFLSDHPNGCALVDIADGVGLNKSTAYRLIKSLVTLNYVTSASGTGCYRLTSKFIAIGNKTHAALDIIPIAQPYLKDLNARTGDAVKLSAREKYLSVLIFHLEPTEGMFRTHAYVGQGHKLHFSGMGKCYLAFSPKGFLEKYWEEEREHIVSCTPNTITNIEVMRHELARIREERISYDREENEIGISCVASPIINVNNKVDHAISITVPSSRFTAKTSMEIGLKVRETADAISREMGWTGENAPKTQRRAITH